MPETDKGEFEGLASRIGGLLGALENIINGNKGGVPPEEGLLPEEDLAPEDGLLPEEGAMPHEDGKKPEGTKLGAEGEAVEKVDPLEQIRSDMALLKSEIKGLPSQDVINKLQAQVAMLPGKDEIVSAVLGKIPKPTCSCQQSIGADNPDLGLGDPRRDGNVE